MWVSHSALYVIFIDYKMYWLQFAKFGKRAIILQQEFNQGWSFSLSSIRPNIGDPPAVFPS